MADAVRYRKLPGHRRGFFRGASVWLGPDHLLLVKSMRFTEQYKRYHFRDVQAIVVAETRRFHISTRAFLIGLLWLIAYPVLLARTPSAHLIMWTILFLLFVAWLAVSLFFSCSCQINTAVSRDDLPSLYRTWTARRFLREVEPLITQAQGSLEQAWAEAVEDRPIGPAPAAQDALPVFYGSPGAPPSIVRTRSLVTDLMLAALFADALWNTVVLHAAGRWMQVTSNLLTLAVLGSAIAVTVQRYRGLIRTPMQRLAIAALAGVGLLYYLRPFFVGIMAGVRASAGGAPQTLLITTSPWSRGTEAALTAVLGLVGLGILIASHDPEQRGIIYPST